MATMLKHVGKVGEKPCVVIFRELPNDTENALVVYSNSLENRQHDEFMSVIQSSEAQQSNDVSQILHTKLFSDGSNMLSSLHFGKKLQKVATSLISLTPRPNQSVPLAEVNAEIRKLTGGYVAPKNSDVHLNQPGPTPRPVDVAPKDDSVTGIARGLLLQAELLENDAKGLLRDMEAKRAEAFKLDPSLRKATPTATPEEAKPSRARKPKTA